MWLGTAPTAGRSHSDRIGIARSDSFPTEPFRWARSEGNPNCFSEWPLTVSESPSANQKALSNPSAGSLRPRDYNGSFPLPFCAGLSNAEKHWKAVFGGPQQGPHGTRPPVDPCTRWQAP